MDTDYIKYRQIDKPSKYKKMQRIDFVFFLRSYISQLSIVCLSQRIPSNKALKVSGYDQWLMKFPWYRISRYVTVPAVKILLFDRGHCPFYVFRILASHKTLIRNSFNRRNFTLHKHVCGYFNKKRFYVFCFVIKGYSFFNYPLQFYIGCMIIFKVAFKYFCSSVSV